MAVPSPVVAASLPLEAVRTNSKCEQLAGEGEDMLEPPSKRNLFIILREEQPMKTYNPKTIAAPGKSYNHGVEISPNSRILYLSGQVAQQIDGSIPEGIEEQSELVWQNIKAILVEAGMTIENLAKINSYVTQAENFPKYAAVRGKHLGSHRPASTSMTVVALSNPRWLVEVEAIATEEAMPSVTRL